MAKKNVRQMLRASVEAEDRAVRDRFSNEDVLLDEVKQQVQGDLSSAASKGRSPSPVLRRPARTAFPSSNNDLRALALVRERLLERGVGLHKSEIIRAGVYALLHAPDDMLRDTLKRLHKDRARRPVFPSARGRARLSRVS
jgi:hypothetical protein